MYWYMCVYLQHAATVQPTTEVASTAPHTHESDRALKQLLAIRLVNIEFASSDGSVRGCHLI